MAGNDNGWNSFMGSREAQVAMYSICVIFSGMYAIQGIRELISGNPNPQLVEAIGETGYYALTIIRTVVLGITAVAFARIVYKTATKKDE